MIHHTITHETAAAHGNFPLSSLKLLIVETAFIVLAITLHNIVFQAQVMGRARESIIAGTFPEYLCSFFAEYFSGAAYPGWCVNALRSVGVDLLKDNPNIKLTPGSGAKWEYSGNNMSSI